MCIKDGSVWIADRKEKCKFNGEKYRVISNYELISRNVNDKCNISLAQNHIFDYEIDAKREIDALGMVKLGDSYFIAELEKHWTNEIRFCTLGSLPRHEDALYDNPLIITYKHNPKEELGYQFSCSGHYIALTYSSYGSFHGRRIKCLDCAVLPPSTVSDFYSGSKIMKIRAICLMKTNETFQVIVTSAWQPANDLDTHAVCSFDESGHPVWDIKWDALGSKSSRFDLRSAATGGQNFFVLNSQGGTVHVISKTGCILQKLLHHLERPLYIAIDPDSNSWVSKNAKILCIALRDCIKVYSFTYSGGRNKKKSQMKSVKARTDV